MKQETIARRIVSDILDKGLAHSTFRDKYPQAYLELLDYREDLEFAVLEKLPKSNTPLKHNET